MARWRHFDHVPPSHRDLAVAPVVAQFATIRPDGAPYVSPMWFDWDGEFVRMTHTRRRKKLDDVRAEPRVAVLVVDPDDPYRYLAFRGVVERIDDDADLAFYTALRLRYGRPVQDTVARVVIVIRPLAVVAQPAGAG